MSNVQVDGDELKVGDEIMSLTQTTVLEDLVVVNHVTAPGYVAVRGRDGIFWHLKRSELTAVVRSR